MRSSLTTGTIWSVHLHVLLAVVLVLSLIPSLVLAAPGQTPVTVRGPLVLSGDISGKEYRLRTPEAQLIITSDTRMDNILVRTQVARTTGDCVVVADATNVFLTNFEVRAKCGSTGIRVLRSPGFKFWLGAVKLPLGNGIIIEDSNDVELYGIDVQKGEIAYQIINSHNGQIVTSFGNGARTGRAIEIDDVSMGWQIVRSRTRNNQTGFVAGNDKHLFLHSVCDVTEELFDVEVTEAPCAEFGQPPVQVLTSRTFVGCYASTHKQHIELDFPRGQDPPLFVPQNFNFEDREMFTPHWYTVCAITPDGEFAPTFQSSFSQMRDPDTLDIVKAPWGDHCDFSTFEDALAHAGPGAHITLDSNPLVRGGGWPDITIDVPNVTLLSNLLAQQGNYIPGKNDILKLTVTASGVTLIGFRILDENPTLQDDTVIVSITGQ